MFQQQRGLTALQPTLFDSSDRIVEAQRGSFERYGKLFVDVRMGVDPSKNALSAADFANIRRGIHVPTSAVSKNTTLGDTNTAPPQPVTAGTPYVTRDIFTNNIIKGYNNVARGDKRDRFAGHADMYAREYSALQQQQTQRMGLGNSGFKSTLQTFHVISARDPTGTTPVRSGPAKSDLDMVGVYR